MAAINAAFITLVSLVITGNSEKKRGINLDGARVSSPAAASEVLTSRTKSGRPGLADVAAGEISPSAGSHIEPMILDRCSSPSLPQREERRNVPIGSGAGERRSLLPPVHGEKETAGSAPSLLLVRTFCVCSSCSLSVHATTV